MARIVVISSSPETRAEVVAALERSHDIRTFTDPWQRPNTRTSAEIRTRLRDEQPDVVVVDANLLLDPRSAASEALRRPLPVTPQPAQDDPQATQPSKRQARTGPSVLVLVEPGQEYAIIPCFDAGADDYAVKPIRKSDLRARVRRLLAQRRAGWDGEVTDPIAISDDGQIIRPVNRKESDEFLVHLGRYQVRGVLGRGGYGVVYRARDMALGRDVALKVLPVEMHDNSEAVTRFLRESTAISRLDHPNIVKFYEMGSFQGRLYFTMELVDGRTLKEIAEREAPLSVGRATRYVAGIAKALIALDGLGLVHRDVKPENVLITHDDQVKLIDFGLVRMRDTAAITSQDDVLGTPYFMAPEYIRAPGIPDIRYDLYALGVTYFHLLCGEYPFDGKNAAHVMEKHLRCQPPRISAYQPGVPLQAELVISRLLEKNPDRRLQKPQDVLTLLRPLMRLAA